MAARFRRWALDKSPFGVQPDADAVQSLGLVKAFLFNEAGGLQVFDLAGGTGLPQSIGTFNGATQPNWAVSPPGPALNFDGASGYISVPDDTALQSTSPNVSVLVHFQAASTPVSDARMVSYRKDANNGFNVIYAANNIFSIENDVGATVFRTNYNTALTVGTWYQGIGVAKGTALGDCYINGVNNPASAATSALGTVTQLTIGARTTPDRWFPGLISCVLIANISWTPNQAIQLYETPFWWMQPMRRAAYLLPAATATKFRKTLSGIGSAVGKRQAHGWGA